MKVNGPYDHIVNDKIAKRNHVYRTMIVQVRRILEFEY